MPDYIVEAEIEFREWGEDLEQAEMFAKQLLNQMMNGREGKMKIYNISLSKRTDNE